jgi:hypothetical protein
MSIEVSRETEARITDEARKQGISVEALPNRLMSDRATTARVAGSTPAGSTPELPVWHPGGAGALHRREIYNDAG